MGEATLAFGELVGEIAADYSPQPRGDIAASPHQSGRAALPPLQERSRVPDGILNERLITASAASKRPFRFPPEVTAVRTFCSRPLCRGRLRKQGPGPSYAAGDGMGGAKAP